jgi:hypothetical protein
MLDICEIEAKIDICGLNGMGIVRIGVFDSVARDGITDISDNEQAGVLVAEFVRSD